MYFLDRQDIQRHGLEDGRPSKGEALWSFAFSCERERDGEEFAICWSPSMDGI